MFEHFLGPRQPSGPGAFQKYVEVNLNIRPAVGGANDYGGVGRGHLVPNGDHATLRLFVRTSGYFEFYAHIKGDLKAGLATGVSVGANGFPKIVVVQISAGGKNYSVIFPIKLSGGFKGTVRTSTPI